MKVYQATIYQLQDAISHAKSTQDDAVQGLLEATVQGLRFLIEEGKDSEDSAKYEQ